jgi:hypothetical protein
MGNNMRSEASPNKEGMPIGRIFSLRKGTGCDSVKNKKRMSGQAETPFILGLMILLSFLIFIGAAMSSRFPDAQIITSFDFGFFAASLIGTAGACAIISGGGCLLAAGFFVFSSFFVISNTILNVLIFIPLIVTCAYVISRLMAGGG